MRDQANCYGCFVNPNWNYHIFPNQPAIMPPLMTPALIPFGGLTDEEKEVLDLLKTAWGKFVSLGFHIEHDLTEFNHAIHQAQSKLALRVARRVDMDVWNQPEMDTENASE